MLMIIMISAFFSARPLNLLNSYDNRFGNALAFASTTALCVNSVVNSVRGR